MSEPKSSHSSSGVLGKGPTSKLREQVALDLTIQTDPKYKKFSQQVEKCLSSFESTHEWPDLIAFLKQLLKTLQSYPQFKEIPRKLIVSKRLAQCLIPALPSGVHQRALDVYSHILTALGPDGLIRDLPLWSSGLFPFFEYASTSVRPLLLDLFEKHYLPLQESLRPVIRSFILALLPGLEEETSEFFDRVLGLLDRISGTVSPAFFFQNIWLIMLTAEVPRAYALNYLARRLPRLDGTEADITPIVGRDIGLLIRAFAAALEDDNLLVQRAALDLLLQSLRVDSFALRSATPKDRSILMQAATGVVLRRDLSLNRRLFSWLLGPDEQSEKQVEYYRSFALDLLSETLRSEMIIPSTEYANSRPYKIFISLLDKWEIGYGLTDKLVFDALISLKRALSENPDVGEDLTVTANSLFEAVEPRVVWKQLYESVRKEIILDGHARQSIDLLTFVFTTFRMNDEEVQNLHLPLIFCALIEILEHIAQVEPRKISSVSFRLAMELLEKIVTHIPVSAMTTTLQMDVPFEGSFDKLASVFYGIPSGTEGQTVSKSSSPIPFTASFEQLVELSAFCVTSMSQGIAEDEKNPKADISVHRTRMRTFIDGTSLLLSLLYSAEKLPGSLSINWDPDKWFDCVSWPLKSEDCTFVAVDRVVSIAISLHKSAFIRPTPSIDNRHRLSVLINALLRYLHFETGPYHARAVKLIWDLEKLSTKKDAESIVAQSLTCCSSKAGYGAYEAFGILWRLSDDSQLPGMHFYIPMLTVIDTLRNADPILRSVGETWMRSNLRSYTRVLDPLLFELLDPSIYRLATLTAIKGREVRGLAYDRPFDQHRISYLLDSLLQVIRFGGQAFGKVAMNTSIGRSLSRQFLDRMTAAGFSKDSSYIDVVSSVILLYLQSEPKPALALSMNRLNVAIQGIVIEILQTIVSRGEVDHSSIDSIESTIITKLFWLIHMGKLELQNKLLHLLHSVISVSAAIHERRRNARLPEGQAEVEEGSLDTSQHPAVNPLLVQVLVDGMSTPSNRQILSHWLDFVLMTVPQFPHIMANAITPLNHCMCRQIRSALGEARSILSSTVDPDTQITSYVDDAELVMLLNGLERLILLSLDESDSGVLDDGSSPVDKSTSDNTGLLTIVSNVFLPDNQTQNKESVLTVRSPGYQALQEGVGVLYSTWLLVSGELEMDHPAVDTLTHIFNRTFARCRKAFERLYRSHAFEVIESVIDYWQDEKDKGLLPTSNGAFDIVDFLTASSQNVVHMVCESISLRANQGQERIRKQVLNPDLTDENLFSFLEEYFEKLEGPLVVQVWSRYLSLAKDVAGNWKDVRGQIFPALRCLTVLTLKLPQSTLLEDRRMRRDIQDTYGKLLDTCILISGRALDQGIWPRRTRDTLTVNGRDSPLSRTASDSNLPEKINNSVPSFSPAGDPSSQKSFEGELQDKINQYLANVVLPNLRRFLPENDKVIAICGNVVYYVVNPYMKAKSSRIVDVDSIIIKILEHLSRFQVAIKTWRSPILDVFNDSKFFSTPPEVGLRWRTVVRTLFDADKSAFTELLGRITTTSSANIFANREYELLLRAQNLRRLAFVIYASEKNHFLTQLPAVIEKLVDIWRASSAPVVESELYLCVRVLLCRLSPHNLSSFWPVLLAELIRLFEQVMADPPSDGSDALQVLLSACKLLDLLLVLQTEEFQIHQWIFVTDTVDAIYRPDAWSPEALLDQLAEIVGNLATSESSRPSPVKISDEDSQQEMRQPLLKTVKQIDSIRDLSPFFSHISISSYESVYASRGVVDWTAVEKSLADDMFDGR